MLGIAFPRVQLCKTRIGSNVDLTADDGLNACFFTSAVKVNYAVHHAVVGDCNRALSALFDSFGQVGNTARTVKQAVFGMQMQMHKILHGLLLSRLFFGLVQQLL